MLEFEVQEIKGTCPVRKRGDKIVVDDPEIVLENTAALCTYEWYIQKRVRYYLFRCIERGKVLKRRKRYTT